MNLHTLGRKHRAVCQFGCIRKAGGFPQRGCSHIGTAQGVESVSPCTRLEVTIRPPSYRLSVLRGTEIAQTIRGACFDSARTHEGQRKLN